jgi:hypothetical protein
VEQKRQDQSLEKDADDRTPARLEKRAYATPVITEYGSVAKLTQSGAGSIADASFSQLKSCL